MRIFARRKSQRRRRSVFIAVLLAACGEEPFAVNGSPGRSLTVAVGQELDIILRTVGPGQYGSPPTISSSTIRFLDMTFVSPVPAGPTQLSRFKAEAAGQAIISFQHSESGTLVIDTVEVRATR